jgi:hypothetical protein
MNTLGGKLIDNRIALHGLISELNEERMHKEILYMTVKGKHPR